MQLHLQVSPADFARNWNAAQVLAGPQLALGANSPYFFGHQLWAETRIELFAQATDTRPDELKTQGVRPRVWFGERWITSIFDLFEENVRYFPSLLPETVRRGSRRRAGRRAARRKLAELRLHNGTIYRWNRPVYDVVGRPAAPAGGEPGAARRARRWSTCWPTAAFYYGVLRTLSDEDRPVWTKMSFAAAQLQFRRVRRARDGRAAVLAGPRRGDARRVGAARSCCRWPTKGCAAGVWPREVRDRYLGVIEGRAKAGRQRGRLAGRAPCSALQERGLTRPKALAEMLRLYCAADAQQRARPATRDRSCGRESS